MAANLTPWMILVSDWLKREKSKILFSPIYLFEKRFKFHLYYLINVSSLFSKWSVAYVHQKKKPFEKSRDVVLTTMKKIHIRDIVTYFHNLRFTW